MRHIYEICIAGIGNMRHIYEMICIAGYREYEAGIKPRG